MYSKVDWGGPVEPFIKVDLKSFEKANPATGNASVSLIVFEYKDLDLLGVEDDSGRKRYICDDELVSQGHCNAEQLYQFIIGRNATDSNAPIKTDVLTELVT
ncbi:Membrane protein PTM1 [Pichia kudriavzevii]|uniref:Membrane protein PTM1 n=1 Tax=Pichia kudriavzevii TaxID=4909 RepID=A0A1V2LH03_PICKU|nr:Membrane protein PTM1 [Pichia kudriavzevii]